MSSQSNIDKKSPAQIAADTEAEKKRLALEAMAGSGDGSIAEILFKFLNFLFDVFLKGGEAPHENAEDDLPDNHDHAINVGQTLFDSRALEKWANFQHHAGNSTVVLSSPVNGSAQVTSGFGHRHAPKAGASTNHAGIDFGARGQDRTPNILAAADGVVLFSDRQRGYGNTVIIGHADGSKTLYGHLSGKQMPTVGSVVARGQIIGEMGNTGNSTATHLHFELRNANGDAVNPKIEMLALKKNQMVVGAQSGNPQYTGLVDHKNMPKLPVKDGADVSPPAYKSLKTNTITHS